jgi:hypothetical protein
MKLVNKHVEKDGSVSLASPHSPRTTRSLDTSRPVTSSQSSWLS